MGPMIKFELDVLEKAATVTFSQALVMYQVMVPNTKALKEVYQNIKEQYKDFDTEKLDLPKIIQEIKDATKDDHDKADLFSSSRIVSALWWLISFFPKQSAEQIQLLDTLQVAINQIDLIHGLIYNNNDTTTPIQ